MNNISILQTACEWNSNYNMYQCQNAVYKMLVLESLDGDTEVSHVPICGMLLHDMSIYGVVIVT